MRRSRHIIITDVCLLHEANFSNNLTSADRLTRSVWLRVLRLSTMISGGGNILLTTAEWWGRGICNVAGSGEAATHP